MNSLDRAILGLIVARLEGSEIRYSSYRKYLERLSVDGVAGFIIFQGESDEVRELILNLQRKANRSLIIASDIERGVGQQIEGATLIPSQMGIASGFDLERNSKELASVYSLVVGEALRIGINLALVPVLDVNTEEENPIICIRAFSDCADTVRRYGKFMIEFFESSGLPTCAKHFPGHGSTKEDSHLELPILKEDISSHLDPFLEAIKSNVSSVMVGHLLVPWLDQMPASLSEKVIGGILRERFKFNRVVMTDAMNMKAIKDFENPYALALRAGADLILHPEEPYLAKEFIIDALRKGDLSEKRIYQALNRIKKLKAKISQNMLTAKVKIEKLPEVNPVEIFKRTVTVIRRKEFLPDLHRLSVYLIGSYSREVFEIFEKNFRKVYEAKDAKEVEVPCVVAIFTEVGFGKRNTLTQDEQRQIRQIIGRGDSILVSFGNPYVLRLFSEADTVIAVYDSHKIAVQAFVEVFSSGLKSEARLPIRLYG